MLEHIDAAATAGARMFGQSNSRTTSAVLSFQTGLPFDRLPEWAALRSRPLAEQRAGLRDPDVRARLVTSARLGNYGRVVGADPRPPDFDTIVVLESAVPPNPSVAEAAARRGVDPVEYMIDIALETDFGQMFTQPFVPASDDDILETLRHPRTVLAFSDSGAHVSQVIDSSIYTHLLAHWVRRQQAFSLEEAIRMLTLAPSRAWNLVDRGLICHGFVADLNVLDTEQVGPCLPTLEHDLPGGLPRLVQRARGFLATIVAGEIVFLEGEHTGALPGRLLRARGFSTYGAGNYGVVQ
jgi:N-acyl-D-aspartate/D-glutamate deacylase